MNIKVAAFTVSEKSIDTQCNVIEINMSGRNLAYEFFETNLHEIFHSKIKLCIKICVCLVMPNSDLMDIFSLHASNK